MRWCDGIQAGRRNPSIESFQAFGGRELAQFSVATAFSYSLSKAGFSYDESFGPPGFRLGPKNSLSRLLGWG